MNVATTNEFQQMGEHQVSTVTEPMAGQRAALRGVLMRAAWDCYECDRGPYDCAECGRVVDRYVDEVLVDFVQRSEVAELEAVDDELVTLSQAVDRRLVLASVSPPAALVRLRMARRRDSRFPEPRAVRNRASLYRAVDLRRWEVNR